jgi:hypothetical protein
VEERDEEQIGICMEFTRCTIVGFQRWLELTIDYATMWLSQQGFCFSQALLTMSFVVLLHEEKHQILA